MPGSNCSISGCGTCRRGQNPYGIFKVPVPKSDDDFHNTWRDELIKIICKDREKTDKLQKQIDESRLHICEKHFKDEQFYTHSCRKSLNEGALPTLNLPTPETNAIENLVRKSIREENEAVMNALVGNVKSVRYEDLKSLMNSIEAAKITGWKVSAESENFYVTDENSIKYTSRVVKFLKYEPPYILPKYEMYVDDSLSFTIRVFGWLLPDTHPIYKDNFRSVQFITVTNLINVIEKYNICEGVCDKLLLGNTVKHAIPKEFDIRDSESYGLNQQEYNRSVECFVIVHGGTVCRSCKGIQQKEQKEINRKSRISQTPAKLRAPMSNTSKERIILALKEQRAENKELKESLKKLRDQKYKECQEEIKNLMREIFKLQSELKEASTPFSLFRRLNQALEENQDLQTSPFMKVFWKEQIEYLQIYEGSGNRVRYNPLIILFCLDLYEKSPSIYEKLRYKRKEGTGVLYLPSQRRLRDYKNEIAKKGKEEKRDKEQSDPQNVTDSLVSSANQAEDKSELTVALNKENVSGKHYPKRKSTVAHEKKTNLKKKPLKTKKDESHDRPPATKKKKTCDGENSPAKEKSNSGKAIPKKKKVRNGRSSLKKGIDEVSLPSSLKKMTPGETTINPDIRTMNPDDTTVNPNETTVNQDGWKMNLDKTTVNPDEVTAGPDKTIVDPDKTPVNPDKTTVNPDETTVDFVKHTVIPCKNAMVPDKNILEAVKNNAAAM